MTARPNLETIRARRSEHMSRVERLAGKPGREIARLKLIEATNAELAAWVREQRRKGKAS